MKGTVCISFKGILEDNWPAEWRASVWCACYLSHVADIRTG